MESAVEREDQESVSKCASGSFFILLANDHFREMLAMFSAGDATGCPFLRADPFIAPCWLHKRAGDVELRETPVIGILTRLVARAFV